MTELATTGKDIAHPSVAQTVKREQGQPKRQRASQRRRSDCLVAPLKKVNEGSQPNMTITVGTVIGITLSTKTKILVGSSEITSTFISSALATVIYGNKNADETGQMRLVEWIVERSLNGLGRKRLTSHCSNPERLSGSLQLTEKRCPSLYVCRPAPGISVPPLRDGQCWQDTVP